MKKTRKILSGIMAVCLSVTAFPKITASAESLKYQYLNYQILNSENGEEYIEITGCDYNIVNVEIPTEINGIPVKSIADSAFYARNMIQTVQLPEGLETIGETAFSGYTKTTTYVFSGKKTYNYATHISSIIIPESVTSIGAGAFDLCENLSEIIILNPECDIYYSSGTLGTFNRTIYSYSGSTVQKYAKAYNLKYQSFYDINNDDIIDAVDASLVLGEYAYLLADLAEERKSELTSSQQRVCDINGDGLVDASDATAILVYYAENSTGNLLDFKDFIDNFY